MTAIHIANLEIWVKTFFLSFCGLLELPTIRLLDTCNTQISGTFAKYGNSFTVVFGIIHEIELLSR